MKSTQATQGTRPPSQHTKEACYGAGDLPRGHQFESMNDVLRAFVDREDPEVSALVNAVADLDDDLARIV